MLTGVLFSQISNIPKDEDPLASLGTCSSIWPIILVAFHSTHSSLSMSFLYWGSSTVGHSTPQVNSVSLATALLMLPIEPVLGLPHHEGTQEGPPGPFLRAVFSPASLQQCWSMGLFFPLWRTLWLSLLTFMRFVLVHFPSCWGPSKWQFCPLAYLSLHTLQLVTTHVFAEAALCPSSRPLMRTHLDQ